MHPWWGVLSRSTLRYAKAVRSGPVHGLRGPWGSRGLLLPVRGSLIEQDLYGRFGQAVRFAAFAQHEACRLAGAKLEFGEDASGCRLERYGRSQHQREGW